MNDGDRESGSEVDEGPEQSSIDLSASFGVLLEDALRRTTRIGEQLDLARQQYSGRIEDRSYRVFIDALKIANERATERIRSIRERFNANDDDLQRGDYDELLAFSLDLDEYLERYLNPLLGQRSEELEVFAMPFTRLAKQLIPNVEILFFVWNADSYRADSDDYATFRVFEPLAAKNLRLAYGRDIRFVQLWYPRIRDADVFQHAVFAHELGHVALELPRNAWAYEVENDDLEEGAARTEEVSGWSPSESYVEAVLRETSLPSELSNDDQTRLTHWFQECACDVFAMRLIGPAFVFAYAEATSSNRPLEPPKSRDATRRFHPPPRLRFTILGDELKRFALGDLEDDLRPKLDAYLSSYFIGEAEEPLSVHFDWVKEAIRTLGKHLPVLLRNDEHPEAEYSPDVLARDLPLVFACAERGVPPVERLHVFEGSSVLDEYEQQIESGHEGPPWSEPIDWRSIINGMLLWHVHRCGPPPADLGSVAEVAGQRAGNRALAARLAIGGVDLSEFHMRAARLRREMAVMKPVDLEGTTP